MSGKNLGWSRDLVHGLSEVVSGAAVYKCGQVKMTKFGKIFQSLFYLIFEKLGTGRNTLAERDKENSTESSCEVCCYARTMWVLSIPR